MTRYRITTPEQVYFSYELAGLVTRAMAWLTDQAMLWALRIAAVVARGLLGGQVGITLAILGIFVLDFGYYVFFELYWAGQSPGKRLLGIRVINARGGRLTFQDVLIRNLLRPVDILVIVPVGGVVALLDRQSRRLGDLAADTMVVRDARVTLPEALLAQRGRVNSFQEDGVLRNRILLRVTRDERDLILDLMMRRDELAPAVREELFGRAAAYFRQRYTLPTDQEYLSDEQTVLNLALVIQATKMTA